MTPPESFKALVREIAGELDVAAKEIHLRPMKRKWASCSSRGRLTFNTELLAEPRKRQVEVILHELLHQKYPNHGKMFSLMMRTYADAFGKSEG